LLLRETKWSQNKISEYDCRLDGLITKKCEEKSSCNNGGAWLTYIWMILISCCEIVCFCHFGDWNTCAVDHLTGAYLCTQSFGNNKLDHFYFLQSSFCLVAMWHNNFSFHLLCRWRRIGVQICLPVTCIFATLLSVHMIRTSDPRRLSCCLSFHISAVAL